MSDNLVLVAEYYNPTDAHLLRAELEANGIEVHIDDNQTAGLLQAVTAARVMVFSDDLDAALRILNEGSELGNVDQGFDAEEDEPLRDEVFGEATEKHLNKDEESTVADDILDRAFNTSVLGLALLPLQVYSVYLLVKLLFVKDEFKTAKRWKMVVAPILNLLLLGVVVSLVRFLLANI